MKRKQGPGRGGRREGAGRKSLDGLDVVAVVTARLDQASLDLVEELGGGSLTVGIRKACHELLRYRNSGTVLTSITNPGTARAILKRPVRAEVPDRAPDGRKYGITKMLELEAAADAAYAAAMKKWEAAQ